MGSIILNSHSLPFIIASVFTVGHEKHEQLPGSLSISFVRVCDGFRRWSTEKGSSCFKDL